MNQNTAKALKYLSAKEATDIDFLLMSEKFGFSIDQLMELAGLSCSHAAFKYFPKSQYPRCLIAVGPGLYKILKYPSDVYLFIFISSYPWIPVSLRMYQFVFCEL